MFHQNIQCLKNKQHDLEVLLETMGNPKILCLTEHWFLESEKQALKIENYNATSIFARGNMQHGGSCVMVNRDIYATEETEVVKRSIEGVIEYAAAVLKGKNCWWFVCIGHPR